LYHHPRAAVYRNAAIFVLVQAFDDILLPLKFHDISKRFKSVAVDKHIHKLHHWKHTTLLRHCCAGGSQGP